MDWPNIMQIVAKINTLKDFNNLNFCNSTVSVALAIPKTMVFVDIFDNKIALANYLHNLLPTHMKNYEERIITTFILLLESNIKENYLKYFCNADTKI